MYRGAMQAILSELIRQDRLKVVASFDLADGKTKTFVAKLAGLGMARATIVSDEVSENAYLGSRNIPYVNIIDVHGLDPASLLRTNNLVLTVNAVKKIEEWLA